MLQVLLYGMLLSIKLQDIKLYIFLNGAQHHWMYVATVPSMSHIHIIDMYTFSSIIYSILICRYIRTTYTYTSN